MRYRKRSKLRFALDFITFPIRALTLFEDDFLLLSSLRSERFFYVSKEVKKTCLDVGCGRDNLFIKDFRNNNGKGIDVYQYKGLDKSQVYKNLKKFPCMSETFYTVTFIATINHIPKSERLLELMEANRCLKTKGRIIITMGNPLAEILVHKLVHILDKFFKTNFDIDGERGMHQDENYFLYDQEIITLLQKAKFTKIRKKYFISQWGLNHMFIAEKN